MGLMFVPDERGWYYLHGIEAKPGGAVKTAVWLCVRYAGVMAAWLYRRARTRGARYAFPYELEAGFDDWVVLPAHCKPMQLLVVFFVEIE